MALKIQKYGSIYCQDLILVLSHMESASGHIVSLYMLLPDGPPFCGSLLTHWPHVQRHKISWLFEGPNELLFLGLHLCLFGYTPRRFVKRCHILSRLATSSNNKIQPDWKCQVAESTILFGVSPSYISLRRSKALRQEGFSSKAAIHSTDFS